MTQTPPVVVASEDDPYSFPPIPGGGLPATDDPRLYPGNATYQEPQYGVHTSILTFRPGMVPKGAKGDQFTGLGTKPSKKVYVDGDEWAPRNQTAADIQILQVKLIAAGVLDRTDVHLGIWDAASAAAYRTVLAQANVYGAAAPDMLDALQQHAQSEAEKNKQNRQFANPEDLRTNLANAAPNLVGGELPQGEQDKYLTYYKQQEVNAYDAELAGTPYTAPMGAEAYVRQQHPEQVSAYNSASRLIEWYRMLGVIG